MLSDNEQVNVFYTGLPDYTIFKIMLQFTTKGLSLHQNTKLSNFESFLLCLMKLRLNLSIYDLGFRFSIHETTISRVLKRWLFLVDSKLFHLIIWPERVQVRKAMPLCFQQNYGFSVISTCIIDCFELFIEKPGDFLTKAAT